MKYILALFAYDLFVILGFLILRHYYDPFYVTSVAFVVLFCKVMLMRLIWGDGTKRPLPDFLPKGVTKIPMAKSGLIILFKQQVKVCSVME